METKMIINVKNKAVGKDIFISVDMDDEARDILRDFTSDYSSTTMSMALELLTESINNPQKTITIQKFEEIAQVQTALASVFSDALTHFSLRVGVEYKIIGQR